MLIHGRYDVSCPLDTAWRLSRSWTTVRLQILDMGHGDDDMFPVAATAALSEVAALVHPGSDRCHVEYYFGFCSTQRRTGCYTYLVGRGPRRHRDRSRNAAR